MSDNPLSIPGDLRWRPPTPRPRDVPVTTEHHCPRDCAHLSEAWRQGFIAGARAERERGGVPVSPVRAFWWGALLTSLIWLVATGLGGR